MREGRTVADTAMDMTTAIQEGSVGRGTGIGRREDVQVRPNTSVPLVPPKPNEFFTATSIGMSRAVLAQ